MLKGYSRALVFVVLGLFLFSFAASFVSADEFTDQIREFVGGVTDLIATPFSSPDSDTKINFAQILMTFIVIMLVYSILDFISIFPTGKHDWIQWAVSAAVGVLSFLFVESGTIVALAYQYEAMGVILTAVLPALIITIFTWKIQEDVITGEKAYGAKLFAIMILFSFGLYLLLRTLGFIPGSEELKISGIGTTINIIIGVFMIFLAFLEPFLVKIFTKKEHESALKSARTGVATDQIDRLNNEIKVLQRTLSTASNAAARSKITARIDEKKHNIAILRRVN